MSTNILSSTYDLCLASGCYSNEKEDKSDRRRYNAHRPLHAWEAKLDTDTVTHQTGLVQ